MLTNVSLKSFGHGDQSPFRVLFVDTLARIMLTR
jgi:hypothetical protein